MNGNNNNINYKEIDKRTDKQLEYVKKINQIGNERNKVTKVLSLLKDYTRKEEEIINAYYLIILDYALSSDEVNTFLEGIKYNEKKIKEYHEIFAGLDNIRKEQDRERDILIKQWEVSIIDDLQQKRGD